MIFIKRQATDTLSDNEWQWVTTSDTTSDSEYNELQRMTTGGTTSDNECYNEWQRMKASNNEWQRVVQWVTTSDHFG